MGKGCSLTRVAAQDQQADAGRQRDGGNGAEDHGQGVGRVGRAAHGLGGRGRRRGLGPGLIGTISRPSEPVPEVPVFVVPEVPVLAVPAEPVFVVPAVPAAGVAEGAGVGEGLGLGALSG